MRWSATISSTPAHAAPRRSPAATCTASSPRGSTGSPLSGVAGVADAHGVRARRTPATSSASCAAVSSPRRSARSARVCRRCRSVTATEFLEELTPFLPHLRAGPVPRRRAVPGRDQLPDLGADDRARCWRPSATSRRTARCGPLGWSGCSTSCRSRSAISIDGVSRQTVERGPRPAPSYEQVMANLRRFVEYRDRHRGLAQPDVLPDGRQLARVRRLPGDGRGAGLPGVRQHRAPAAGAQPLPPARRTSWPGWWSGLERDLERVGDRLDMNRLPLRRTARPTPQHAARAGGRGADVRMRGWRTATATAAWRRNCAPTSRTSRRSSTSCAAQSLDGEVSVLRCDADERLVDGTDYMGIDGRAVARLACERLLPDAGGALRPPGRRPRRARRPGGHRQGGELPQRAICRRR